MGRERATRLGLALLLAGGVGGCSLIFGDVDKVECRVDEDCFDDEICPPSGVCVVGERLLPPDRGFEPEPDAELDLGPDLAVEMPDAEVDLAVDAGPIPDADPATVAFAEGDCFEGREQGTFDPADPPVGDLHVPTPACTPFARLWTARTDDGVELAWDLDGDAVAEGRLPVGGGFAVGAGVAFAPSVRDGDGLRSMLRVGLRDGEVAPVRVGPFDQRTPSWAAGRLAFVETVGGRPPGVIIIDDVGGEAPTEWDCALPGVSQWGPVAADRYTAWFEQPVGSRRTRVVVLDGPLCDEQTARRVEVLDGAVATDARLWAVDDGLVWLQPKVDGPGNHLRRWRFADPGARVETLYLDGRRLRVDPVRPPAAGPNPVELVAAGHRLAVVGYAPDAARRYVLDTVDLAVDRERAVTRAGQGDDARAPWLSASYLLWAEADRLGIWRMAYERLD